MWCSLPACVADCHVVMQHVGNTWPHLVRYRHPMSNNVRRAPAGDESVMGFGWITSCPCGLGMAACSWQLATRQEAGHWLRAAPDSCLWKNRCLFNWTPMPLAQCSERCGPTNMCFQQQNIQRTVMLTALTTYLWVAMPRKTWVCTRVKARPHCRWSPRQQHHQLHLCSQSEAACRALTVPRELTTAADT